MQNYVTSGLISCICKIAKIISCRQKNIYDRVVESVFNIIYLTDKEIYNKLQRTHFKQRESKLAKTLSTVNQLPSLPFPALPFSFPNNFSFKSVDQLVFGVFVCLFINFLFNFPFHK